MLDSNFLHPSQRPILRTSHFGDDGLVHGHWRAARWKRIVYERDTPWPVSRLPTHGVYLGVRLTLCDQASFTACGALSRGWMGYQRSILECPIFGASSMTT